MKWIRLWSLILVCALVSACGPKLPPGYSAKAQRANNANQLLQSLIALGQTAQNLNALAPGSQGRLSDADTAAVRDASMLISDAIPGYVDTGLSKGIRDGFTSLQSRTSSSGNLSPGIRAAIALINTNVQLILGVQ